MRTALILHGTCDREEYFSDEHPSLSNSHWLPWLQKQLLMKGIFTQTPEMPEAYKPDYSKWKKEFERFTVDKNTILIGFSTGAGFLIRWLSENKVELDKLVLVAPWMDPKREATTTFFDFSIDREMQNRAREIHVLSSDNEWVKGVKEAVEIIKKALPKVHIHRFKNKGHFTCNDMKTDKFPELLEITL